MNTEMLSGKPLKSIIKFGIPILIGNLFQQLYNMVDTLIVGQTLTNEALAGVGATGAISFVAIGFIQGLTSGFSVMTSQRYGAGDSEGVRKSVAVSFCLSVVLGVVITIVAALTAMPLLKLMGTPGDIIEHSYSYLIVIFWGLPATMLYNSCSNIMRSLGDSKTPLYFLIGASVINVGLDLLFIIVFKMGVAGAGYATVLSQGLSGLLCLAYMFKKFPILHLKKEDFRFKRRFAINHITLGIPMALQFSIIGVGVMVQQTALNAFGSTVLTAYTAAYKIDQFAVQFMLSLGMSLAVYCGQNAGACRYDRIKDGVNRTAVLGIIIAVASGIFVSLLARPLTKLFISDISDEILTLSQQFLIFQGIFYIALASIFVYRNALQGMGYSSVTMAACLIELVMRTIAALVLAKKLEFTGICLSNPVAWLGAGLILVSFYYFAIHRKLSKHGHFIPGLVFRFGKSGVGTSCH